MKFKLTNYVAIQVDKYQQAVHFYENVLGLRKLETNHKETVFQSGNITLFIEDNQRGKTFFEFKVDNIKKAKDLLISKGCTITEERSENSIMCDDPFGMCFHLYQD